jgi:HK97 family phage major capsid protein
VTPTTVNPVKRRLADLQITIGQARERRSELLQARDQAREEFIESGGDDKSSQYDKARAAVRALGEQDDRIANLQQEQTELLKQLAGEKAPDGDAGRSAAPPAPMSAPWATADLLAADNVRHELEQMASTKMQVGRVMLGEVIDRDRLAADVTGTDYMRRGTYLGVVPQLRRQFRVLDLIPTGTCDGNLVPYTQEGGTFGAAETAEGTTKPEDGVTYTDAEAKVVTIASWQKLRKQSLSDYAALQSMIDNRLRYSVSLRLENQILAGDGAGSNLTGILNTSGIGSVAFSGAVPLAELILTGIVNVFTANAEANGIVLNPADWKTVLTQKAQLSAGPPPVGSGEYVGGGPFSVTPQVMWGVALVPSNAIPQGSALVGDFGRGAQLLIREGVTVLLSDSDQDDFTKNRVTLLGEMRAAMPVFRPVAFQKVALA